MNATSKGSIHAVVLGVAVSLAFGGGTSVGLALGIAVARNLIGWDDEPVTSGPTSDQVLTTGLAPGTIVRIVGGVLDGEAYSYRGPPLTGTVDLRTIDYTDPSAWARVGLIATDAGTEALISGANVYATGAVTLSATSSQTIEALVIAAAAAVAGGANDGVALSGAGAYAENRIHASTRAAIDGGDVDRPASRCARHP